MIAVYIKTYGCQANVADSMHLERYMQGLGCSIVTTEAQADLILVNSCAIRDKAEKKMFSYIGDLLQYKSTKPYLMIGVIGCVASYRHKEIMDRYGHINFVFRAKDSLEDFKAYIADLIESIKTQKTAFYHDMDEYRPQVVRDRDVVSVVTQKKLHVAHIDDGNIKNKDVSFQRAMINIMRGCNNYCSYCIVPFTTGRERSFPMSSILNTVKSHVTSGAKEIMLLGQNVDSYKDPETGASFAKLLKEVAHIPGDFWVRFMSPHPKDMTTDVVDCIAQHNQKLCAFIHLPLQSGSNAILDAMNRTYTAEKYMEQVAYIRKKLPHAAITTDIIVGFPGETELDYQATIDIVKQVRYQMIFSFIYSPRKYTKAALLEDNCSHDEKQKRLEALQILHREIGTEENKKLIGKRLRVLIEGNMRPGVFWGRTEGNIRTIVYGVNQDIDITNQFVFVEIDSAQLTGIEGVFLSEFNVLKKDEQELSERL